MATEPKPTACPICFQGYRGMDRCAKCDGTGSIFIVGGKSFPNTKDGYEKAKGAKK